MPDGQLPGLETPDPDPPHLCHAKRCKTAVPEAMLMCRRHWAMVPKWLQRKVWAVYVPGQEITKTPTGEYLEVAQEAIDYVDAAERAVR